MELPRTPFDLSGHEVVRTNGWGKFTLDKGKHEYSASPEHANSAVNIRLTSSRVFVLDGDFREIVAHNRLYGDEKRQSMAWLPYLRYIAQRLRSLRNTGIYDMMPADSEDMSHTHTENGPENLALVRRAACNI